eukprot:g2029.t1
MGTFFKTKHDIYKLLEEVNTTNNSRAQKKLLRMCAIDINRSNGLSFVRPFTIKGKDVGDKALHKYEFRCNMDILYSLRLFLRKNLNDFGMPKNIVEKFRVASEKVLLEKLKKNASIVVECMKSKDLSVQVASVQFVATIGCFAHSPAKSSLDEFAKAGLSLLSFSSKDERHPLQIIRSVLGEADAVSFILKMCESNKHVLSVWAVRALSNLALSPANRRRIRNLRGARTVAALCTSRFHPLRDSAIMCLSAIVTSCNAASIVRNGVLQILSNVIATIVCNDSSDDTFDLRKDLQQYGLGDLGNKGEQHKEVLSMDYPWTYSLSPGVFLPDAQTREEHRVELLARFIHILAKVTTNEACRNSVISTPVSWPTTNNGKTSESVSMFQILLLILWRFMPPNNVANGNKAVTKDNKDQQNTFQDTKGSKKK